MCPWMTVRCDDGSVEAVYVQTEPALSTAPVNVPALLRRIESRAYETWKYGVGTPLTVPTAPTDGVIVVNGRPVTGPFTLRPGDLVAWFPGEVC